MGFGVKNGRGEIVGAAESSSSWWWFDEREVVCGAGVWLGPLGGATLREYKQKKIGII